MVQEAGRRGQHRKNSWDTMPGLVCKGGVAGLHTVGQWHEGLCGCCWAGGNRLRYWSGYRRPVSAGANPGGELQVVKREPEISRGRGS